MAKSKRVLIVEDEVAIREMIHLFMEKEGFKVKQAESYRDAIRKLNDGKSPHIILLDWMMPGKSGLELLHYLKQHEKFSKIPVVMLTAKNEEKDIIACLNEGADDYITKPFSPKELLARINAVLRRSRAEHIDESIEIDGLILDTSSRRVTCQDKEISLSTTEFKLLQFLIENQERVYSRDMLLDNVWGNDIYVEDRTVDVYIRRLRKSLAPVGFDKYVQTVRGAGYRFSKQFN